MSWGRIGGVLAPTVVGFLYPIVGLYVTLSIVGSGFVLAALAVAILGLAFAYCGIAVAEEIPLPRPRPPIVTEPQSFREAAGPDFNSDAVTSEPSACRTRLEAIAIIDPMPRLIGPGACGGGDMVQLNAVRLAKDAHIVVKPAPIIRCEIAESATLKVG